MYDVTALFVYSLGCSLVQLSMFVAMFVIEWPSVDAAKKIDQDFKQNVLA